MEIKIKDHNGYIEADWTIENGVMIVSPKKEKIDLSQFKDGDVLHCSHSNAQWVCIYRGEAEYMGDNIYMEDYCSLDLYGGKSLMTENSFSDAATHVRHATEEEKQRLFDRLAEEGWKWDAENKQLVKLKWKPKNGEFYYSPFCRCVFFEPCKYQWGNTDFNNSRYDKGWVFKTEAECQEYCDRLNKAIENIKP